MSTAPDNTPAAPKWRGFAKVAGVLVAIVLVLALPVVLAFVCHEQIDMFAKTIGYGKTDEMSAGARFIRDSVVFGVAVIGIAMAMWRNYSLDQQSKAANRQAETAAKQFEFAEKRLYSDQFDGAVEAMGRESKDGRPLIDARVSGIYTIANLAIKQPAEFAERVVVNLIAYIKDNARGKEWSLLDANTEPKKLRELGGDVKAAFSALSNILNKKEVKIDKKILDFSGHSFGGFDFSGIDLRPYKKWVKTNFAECCLIGAHFADGADMRWANFFGAEMQKAILKGANLKRADMREANLAEADMQGCYAFSANFEQLDLADKYTIMEQTQLAGAYLLNAKLSGIQMHKADLRGAVLDHANLFGTDELLSANFGETCMVEINVDEFNEKGLSELAKPGNRKIWLTPEDVDGQNGDSPGKTDWRLEQYTDGYALAGVLMNYAGAPIPEDSKPQARKRLLHGEPANIRRQAAKLEKLPDNTPEEIKVWLKEIKAKYSK